MKEPQVGDIFEFVTSDGLAYGQFTHDTVDGNDGEVLRILEGVHQQRPATFTGIPTKFVLLYPLKELAKKGEGVLVTNEEVPPEARVFPMFRNGTPGADGKVHVWWLWDGHEEKEVGRLTAEQRKLPFLEIFNPEALIDALESGWTPENDPRN